MQLARVTAGEREDRVAPRCRIFMRELKGEEKRWRIGARRQRLVDETLKETGNGFAFTTHFALGLTFGEMRRLPSRAAVAAVLRGG